MTEKSPIIKLSCLVTNYNQIEWIEEAVDSILNQNMDFAYEIVLTKEMIEKCEAEAARLFFDVPYSSYQDFHIPLSMLKKGVWRSDTAIQYIRELRNKGFVDNSDYDIW
mgnify:CR=1 FL=1